MENKVIPSTALLEHLKSVRPGIEILGMEFGERRESGYTISQRTQLNEPEIWNRVPDHLKQPISTSTLVAHIDQVGNMKMQAVYEMPEIPMRIGEEIKLVPDTKLHLFERKDEALAAD